MRLVGMCDTNLVLIQTASQCIVRCLAQHCMMKDSLIITENLWPAFLTIKHVCRSTKRIPLSSRLYIEKDIAAEWDTKLCFLYSEEKKIVKNDTHQITLRYTNIEVWCSVLAWSDQSHSNNWTRVCHRPVNHWTRRDRSYPMGPALHTLVKVTATSKLLFTNVCL